MRVLLPSPLFSYTNGVSEVEARGDTISDALDDLDARFPGLRFRVVDEQGAIRPHVRFWVSTRLARSIGEPVGRDDTLSIVAALSGG